MISIVYVSRTEINRDSTSNDTIGKPRGICFIFLIRLKVEARCDYNKHG